MVPPGRHALRPVERPEEFADLVFNLNRHARTFYHLGLALVKCSTLADANKPRPAVIFEKTYYKLYERLAQEMEPQSRQAPKIKISDATTIELSAPVFPWATFRSRKGAVKLHTVLTGQLPHCVIVTDGKTHDQKAIQDLRFEAGDFLIFDRASLDGSSGCTRERLVRHPPQEQLLLRGGPDPQRGRAGPGP